MSQRASTATLRRLAPSEKYKIFVSVLTGHDIRSWHGYPVLRDIRELSTLTALLRDGHINVGARRELQLRLRSLRTGDDQQWTPF